MIGSEMARRIAHLKELARRQSQQHLAQAIDRKRQADRRLQELISFQQEQENMLEQFLATSHLLPAGFWSQWGQYQQQMKEQIQLHRQQVERAAIQETEKRQEVIARSVDEKKWNKVKQMVLAQQLVKAKKQEQKELDDLASIRHVYGL